MRVDLLLQFLHRLFRDTNGISPGDKAAWRLLLVGDHHKGTRELRWVTRLLSVHGLVPLHSLSVTVGVLFDERLGVSCRLRREQFGAEESGIDDGRANAEWLDLGM